MAGSCGTVLRRLWRGRAGAPSGRVRRIGDVVLVAVALALELMIWDGEQRLHGGGSAPAWAVAAATAAVFTLLLLRRRRPVAVFALQVCYAAGAAWLIPRSDFSAGVLVALHAVAARCPPRLSALAATACALPFGLQLYQRVERTHAPAREVVVLALLSGLAPLVAWAMGYRTWRADHQIARLEAEREAATARALRAERLRIARELHDIVAHSVSVMVLYAAGAHAVLASDPQRAEAALRVIQDTGAESMSELRRLLGLLRSAGADPAGEAAHQPGLADLDELVHQMRGAGLAVTAEVAGVPGRLDPSVNLAAYRVVQESLTNTLKHAGPGSAVRVHLGWGPHELVLTVEDRAAGRPDGARNGAGLSTGHGLLGLRERVGTAGGMFDAHPIDGGFVTQVTLPCATGAGREPVPAFRSGSEETS